MQNLKNIKHHILSKGWATLFNIEYDYKFKNGNWKTIKRETYNRGNGAAILLYNKETKSIILTKQFRMPAYQNNVNDGMCIEACAGAIDGNESPETCIIRETEEEVGYKIESAKLVYETYTSPGALTEKMYLFIAEYNSTMKISKGGGLDTEDEEIEVLELPFKEALNMMDNKQIIDAKTIMLMQYMQINKVM